MDVLWFLEERLKFTDRLYNSAVSPFQETKRKIEKEEEPFVDDRDPEREDVSEPAFLEEWTEADTSEEVIGHWCLNMVYSSLKAVSRSVCLRNREVLPRWPGSSAG